VVNGDAREEDATVLPKLGAVTDDSDDVDDEEEYWVERARSCPNHALLDTTRQVLNFDPLWSRRHPRSH